MPRCDAGWSGCWRRWGGGWLITCWCGPKVCLRVRLGARNREGSPFFGAGRRQPLPRCWPLPNPSAWCCRRLSWWGSCSARHRGPTWCSASSASCSHSCSAMQQSRWACPSFTNAALPAASSSRSKSKLSSTYIYRVPAPIPCHRIGIPQNSRLRLSSQGKPCHLVCSPSLQHTWQLVLCCLCAAAGWHQQQRWSGH